MGVVGVGQVPSTTGTFCPELPPTKNIAAPFQRAHSNHLVRLNSWHILPQFAPTTALCAGDILTLNHVGVLTLSYNLDTHFISCYSNLLNEFLLYFSPTTIS